MTNLDFAPLYRSTVGFDHVASLFDAIATERNQQSYPPYNIQRIDDDFYKITMAVAGFSEDEIDIIAENDMLTISAKKRIDGKEKNYLHRGIAERNFRRQFRLDNFIKVINASLENGLLHVTLEREIPDAMKPRKISINESKPLN
jgi:molecular chaperone IbpA